MLNSYIFPSYDCDLKAALTTWHLIKSLVMPLRLGKITKHKDLMAPVAKLWRGVSQLWVLRQHDSKYGRQSKKWSFKQCDFMCMSLECLKRALPKQCQRIILRCIESGCLEFVWAKGMKWKMEIIVRLSGSRGDGGDSSGSLQSLSLSH